MSRETRFVETPKGICVINPIAGEYTICGDAFDLNSDEPGYEWKPTKVRVVTCADCARMIESFRNVRTWRD